MTGALLGGYHTPQIHQLLTLPETQNPPSFNAHLTTWSFRAVHSLVFSSCPAAASPRRLFVINHPGGPLTGRAYRSTRSLFNQSTSSHLRSNPLHPPLQPRTPLDFPYLPRQTQTDVRTHSIKPPGPLSQSAYLEGLHWKVSSRSLSLPTSVYCWSRQIAITSYLSIPLAV